MTMTPYDWFSVYGIELEYMIVDAQDLRVRPIADQVLRALAGRDTAEVERGAVAWSNELARHVIEVKTNGPCADLQQAAVAFHEAIIDVHERLTPLAARLLPSGMHPWMNPEQEFQLWPVDEEGIYNTFDRIFDCRGHGWSNLQSMHINLPFKDDEQLQGVHESVRMLLPLMPALAASSPYVEGKRARHADERLAVYRSNARRVPSVSGWVIPESVKTRQEYEARVLEPIYHALAPFDEEGILRHEWVNARGAIARFDRMAVEIRVLDTQECPRMDVAVAYLVTETLRQVALDGRFSATGEAWPPERLAATLSQVILRGGDTVVDDAEYLSAWGLEKTPRTAREVWADLISRLPTPPPSQASLHADARWLVDNGSLSERLVRKLGATPQLDQLRHHYGTLADCLLNSRRFE